MTIKKVTIIQSIIVNAKPNDVYDALMDPKKHAEFTGSEAKGNSTIGGRFTAWDGYIEAKNLELEKGKRILQEWVTSDWPHNFPPSKLELKFSEVNGKTEIKMIHSDVPSTQEKDLRQGWEDFYWKPLKTYFENRSQKN